VEAVVEHKEEAIMAEVESIIDDKLIRMNEMMEVMEGKLKDQV